jgi:hypothetical protein
MEISFLFSVSKGEKRGYLVGFATTPITVGKIKRSVERIADYIPPVYILKYKGNIINHLPDETEVDLQKGDIIDIEN